MIALKLILQSLAGVVAVGGAVGGTVALTRNPQSEDYGRSQRKITEIDLDVNNETTKAFYLVSSAISIADTLPSTDLFTDEKNPTEKNYQCVNSSQTSDDSEETITKDSSCLLYSLKSAANKSLKISEIKASISNLNTTPSLVTKVIKKTELKYKKFFLLEGHKDLIQFSINDRQPIIYLITKESTDIYSQSNLYVILQVHAKIAPDEVTGATETIIAKTTTDQQDTRTQANVLTPSYECSFKSEETKTDCVLSKLSAYTNSNSFNFSGSEIKNKKEGQSTQKNSYYFIQSAGIEVHEAKDLKGATVTYIETQKQNSITTTPLTVEAAVFAKLDNSRTRLTELIILDQ